MRLGKLKVDFLPDDAAILGFTNRWYAEGIETAAQHQLSDHLSILVLTPPLFLGRRVFGHRCRWFHSRPDERRIRAVNR